MCISRNGLITAHIVSRRNTLCQVEKALVGATQHSIRVLPSMGETKLRIIINYKIHVFREQTGRNTIADGAAMAVSAAPELCTVYCAVCTLHKYLPVNRKG